MTEWMIVVSYLLTNGLRLILGLYLVVKLMDVELDKKAIVFSILGSCLVTALNVSGMTAAGVVAAEIAVLSAITWYYLREQLRTCLFLIFFYEVGVALWEFLISAGLSVLFHSTKFMDTSTTEYLISIWLMRLIMMAVAVLLVQQQGKGKNKAVHLASIVAIFGVFGVIVLSQQTILTFSDDQLITWTILSVMLMFAILLYRVNRQHEMEAEIVRLKQTQAEILERDYQALRKTYTDNAKLYHDLHNHIEAIYQCLTQGDITTAVKYCEDLRTPVREISQTVWTGDKAADYLISSKMALAEQMKVKTKVNIEYPYNTNIRSVDLTTILGNLLDNALEAVETAAGDLRFLSLTIRRINDMLIIKVKNGCKEAPMIQGGQLQTTKKDTGFHGWGIKSVLAAAQRYDGTVDTDFQNGVFQAVVTLSYHPIKRK